MTPKLKTKGRFAEQILAESLVREPWKNGSGVTSQIAIEPTGATLAKGDFLWRLSSAEVASAGAFTAFPGFDRLLSLLQGEELVLAGIDKRLMPGEIVAFRGEEAVSAELPRGPVVDLGLIYDRARVRAKMHYLALIGKPRAYTLSAPTVMVTALSAGRAILYPGEEMFLLEAGDTLKIGPLGEERILQLDGVRYLLVEVSVK